MYCWLFACVVAMSAQLGDRYADQLGDLTGQPSVTEETSTSPAETEPDSEAEQSSTAESPAEQSTPSNQELPLDSAQAADGASNNAVGSERSANSAITSLSGADPLPKINPETLLEDCQKPPLGGRLMGTPLSLADAVTGAGSRAAQTCRVEAYWELAFAVTRYYLTHQEEIELSTARQSIANPNAEWQMASDNLAQRKEFELVTVRLAQKRLATLLGRDGQFAPLPSDNPFCGEYNTRYAEIFDTRSSELAARFDDYLPLAYEEIKSTADTVAKAHNWWFAVSQQRSPQSDGIELLLVYQLYADSRREFLDAVEDYNQQIARYTELAIPTTIDTRRLVAMLIRTDDDPTSTFDPNVQNSSHEEDQSSIDQPNQLPRTSWTAVPTSGERSILVPGRPL